MEITISGVRGTKEPKVSINAATSLRSMEKSRKALIKEGRLPKDPPKDKFCIHQKVSTNDATELLDKLSEFEDIRECLNKFVTDIFIKGVDYGMGLKK